MPKKPKPQTSAQRQASSKKRLILAGGKILPVKLTAKSLAVLKRIMDEGYSKTQSQSIEVAIILARGVLDEADK